MAHRSACELLTARGGAGPRRTAPALVASAHRGSESGLRERPAAVRGWRQPRRFGEVLALLRSVARPTAAVEHGGLRKGAAALRARRDAHRPLLEGGRRPPLRGATPRRPRNSTRADRLLRNREADGR